MASITKVKKTGMWLARVRVIGQKPVSRTFLKKQDAINWAAATELELRGNGAPQGLGAQESSLAVALNHYCHENAIEHKGCLQVLSRANRYLAAAGLAELVIDKTAVPLHRDRAHVFTLVEKPKRKAPTDKATAYRAKRDKRNKQTRAAIARLATMKMGNIGASDIKKLVSCMKQDGYAATSIRLELSLLSALFEEARRVWNWKPLPNPLRDVTWPAAAKGRDRTLLPHEEDALLAALIRRNKPGLVEYIGLAIETCMRRGELLRTTQWQDLDLDVETPVIHLVQTKVGETDDVPLTDEAVTILRSLPQGQPGDRLFAFTETELQKAWEVSCAEANIKNLHVHDLRHSGATRLALRFDGDTILMRLVTRHRQLSQLQKYLNPTTKDVVKKFRATKPTIVSPMVAAAMARNQATVVLHDQPTVAEWSPPAGAGCMIAPAAPVNAALAGGAA